MDITRHLLLVRIVSLSDPFIAVTLQLISVQNWFHRSIMKFQNLKNRWVYVVSIYRCCRAKIGEDIMRANREVGEVYHMGLEYFIQKTKKGGVQIFLMFDKKLITKLGSGENTDSLGGK